MHDPCIFSKRLNVAFWGVHFGLGGLYEVWRIQTEPSPPYTGAPPTSAYRHLKEFDMLFREVTAGWAKRIRLENSVALQRAEYVRPAQVRLEVSTILNDINVQLKADKDLQKVYDSVKITVPSNS